MTKKKADTKTKPKPLDEKAKPKIYIDRVSSQGKKIKLNPKSFGLKVFRKGSMFLTKIGRPQHGWQINGNRSLRIEHDQFAKYMAMEAGELKTQSMIHDQNAVKEASQPQEEKPVSDGGQIGRAHV